MRSNAKQRIVRCGPALALVSLALLLSTPGSRGHRQVQGSGGTRRQGHQRSRASRSSIPAAGKRTRASRAEANGVGIHRATLVQHGRGAHAVRSVFAR